MCGTNVLHTQNPLIGWPLYRWPNFALGFNVTEASYITATHVTQNQ